MLGVAVSTNSFIKLMYSSLPPNLQNVDNFLGKTHEIIRKM